MQWNGTTLFEQQDITATAWTNLQFLVTATGTSSVLQLGFQDDPEFLGLDDISLKATSVASVKAAARKAENFEMVWNVSPNSVYQAQYKTNLSQPGWINLGTPATASSGTLMLTHTNAFGTHRSGFIGWWNCPEALILTPFAPCRRVPVRCQKQSCLLIKLLHLRSFTI